MSCLNSVTEFIFRDNSYTGTSTYCFLSYFESEILINTVELQWLEQLWDHEN